MKHAFLLATVCLGCLMTASSVKAANCTVPPHDNGASGDNAYYQMWNCNRDFVLFFWEHYEMDKGNWDNGFGFENACNIDLPLGRTINAIAALHYASPDPPTDTDDFGGDLLRWGGNYAMAMIDELDAECGDGGRAYTLYTPGWDQYTELYLPFFYEESPVQRAATLVHEARHADFTVVHYHPHDGDDCIRGKSCDDEYGHKANSYQVYWLYLYTIEAPDVGPGQRAIARDEANLILREGFNNVPGYQI